MQADEIPILAEAQKLNEEGKYEEALAMFDQILAQNQDNPQLLATMATILIRHSRSIGQGISMFHKAIDKAKEKKIDLQVEVMANLATGYRYAGMYDKSREWFEKALKKEPTAGTMTNYGSMFVENDNPDKGREMLEKAIKMDPSLYMAHWNLSLLLLEHGEWERGWKEYEYGERAGGMRPERAIGGKPKWDGSPGKTVVIHGEQGIGDEIMFASMLPDVMKTNTVIFECHDRLKHLFEHSFPGLKCYGTRKEAELFWPDTEVFDARIAIGSLGKFYRNSQDSFPGTPYLKADPLLPKGKKFRVGISWTGGRLTQRVAKRTVPLNWWKSILSNDCEFVSLQYTDQEAEVKIVEQTQGVTIHQYPEAKHNDYYETARLVASCDLVITVCTSIVHLAGALGVPCWVMTPKHPAWRYQRSGRMPWYKSVRLYRQPEAGEGPWMPIVEKIGFDLSELLSGAQRKVA